MHDFAVEFFEIAMIVVGFAWLLTTAVAAFLIATAPKGREDEDGFHRE